MTDFFTICPRDNLYLSYNANSIPLRIIANDGIENKPDVNITVSDLNGGYKHFHNAGSRGSVFNINIFVSDDDYVPVFEDVIKENSYWNDDYDKFRNKGFTIDNGSFYNKGVLLSETLDYFIRNMIPVTVISESKTIDNGLYIITNNSSRKQNYKGGSVWSLEFTLFDEFNYRSFSNVNKGVTSALKKYEKKKANSKKKAQKEKAQKVKTTAKYKLQHNCKASQLKYTTNKKSVTCVKYMQKILNNKLGKNLKLDGWFGKETKQAVKDFQKKYKKKYKLKESGNVDNATFKALYTV